MSSGSVWLLQLIRLDRLISLDGSSPINSIKTTHNILFRSSMFRGSVAFNFLGVLCGIQLGKLNKILLSITLKKQPGDTGGKILQIFQSQKPSHC